METFLIRAVQLILSLSILVVLHEFGHFGFSRLFKVRVDKFYMFFNPNFSLFRAKKINGKWQYRFLAKNVPANERPKLDEDGNEVKDAKGRTVMEPIPVNELPDDDWRKYPENTEWGIGWLPLGGYCKIAGMIDESMDTVQLAQEPQPWEYRSKSVWKRLPIIVGGVLMNFILALVIYSAVLFTWGQDYLPLKNATYGLEFSKTCLDNGFKNGDKIVAVNGQPVDRVSDLVDKIMLDGNQNVAVLRDGKQINLHLPADFPKQIIKADEKNIISVRFPFVVADVSNGSPAQAANLQAGDSIVGLNGKHMFIFQDIASQLSGLKDSVVNLSFYRSGQLMQTKIHISGQGKMGVELRQNIRFFKTKHLNYTFFQAIPAGVNLGIETLSTYVKQFKFVFSKAGAQNLGGFGAIGKMFAPVWDWQSFWSMTALLSIILAFMNFLPIPALDGGHVLFLVYEIVTGRKPNEKFLEYAQTVGFFLLLALLIYANGNDIFRAIFK